MISLFFKGFSVIIFTCRHMEGSLLSEEQTRMIFETRTLEAGEGIPVDDIIEASNHFRCVDYVLDVATEPLSEEMIKRLHFLLKQGTKDSDLDWFAVRVYKKDRIRWADGKHVVRATFRGRGKSFLMHIRRKKS